MINGHHSEFSIAHGNNISERIGGGDPGLAEEWCWPNNSGCHMSQEFVL